MHVYVHGRACAFMIRRVQEREKENSVRCGGSANRAFASYGTRASEISFWDREGVQP
jgi:hypothetical protein